MQPVQQQQQVSHGSNDQSKNPFVPPAALLEASKVFSKANIPAFAVFAPNGECISLAWNEEQAGTIADGVANQRNIPIAVYRLQVLNYAIPDVLVNQSRGR